MSDTLLVVEDDDTIRTALSRFLGKTGYQVDAVASASAALALLQQRRYALILLDLRLPDGNGLELLPQLLALDEQALVVMMTAFPEVRTAVAALKAGAYDYLNKPFDLHELPPLIERALEARHLRRELAWRRLQPQGSDGAALIGESGAFRDLLTLTRRIAAVDRLPALILGETGSGKERIARAVHDGSPRHAGPWISVNCSALAEGLLESEMFGHEKGAFTDAKTSKPGLFELADGGTLFLDEIGDLSPALQPKLLRVLDSQRFRRVGGSKEIQVDVRIVAATHRDLRQRVAQGAFREDLYFRLNVGTIAVPPLRERQADIALFARHFLAAIGTRMGVPPMAFTADALQALQRYPWPGNVRELRNVIERAALLAGAEIGVGDLPSDLAQHGVEPGRAHAPTPAAGIPGVVAGEQRLAGREREHILSVLQQCAGNRSKTAEALGISRPTLRNKLREYGLDAKL